MKRGFYFILGVVVGGILFGGTIAYATGIIANPSPNRIFVNGQEVKVEAYVIDGRNYLQIRDMAAAIDFSVVWDGANNSALIDTTRGYDPNETVQTSEQTTEKTTHSDIWLDEDYELYENELEVVRRVNEERAKAGLSPVTLNIELSKVARIKAVEMVELNYFAHESPTYGTILNTVRYFGIECKWVGENIARLGGTNAGGVMSNWMRSEGHRNNILHPKHKEIGVGVAKKDGIGYWSLFLIH